MKFFPINPGILLLITLLVSCQGCRNKNPFDKDVSHIEPRTTILHFEESLMEIPDTLFYQKFPEIYPQYRELMHNIPLDSMMIREWMLFRSDPHFTELFQRKREMMENMETEDRQIEELMRYYRYHFPEEPDYKFFTQFSGIDPQTLHVPVLITEDHFGVISTDLFLGADFDPYVLLGIPEYKRRWMTPPQIAPEIARQLAFQHSGSPGEAESLLEQMVFYGKVLLFLDAMMPSTPDSLKIKYTGKQLDWCQENQKNVWAYLVNNNMLYSSDVKQIQMFMQEAPFTSVFTEKSPGRIGQWLGWQIVRRYMEKKPDTPLRELMEETDARKILSVSGYKPR